MGRGHRENLFALTRQCCSSLLINDRNIIIARWQKTLYQYIFYLDILDTCQSLIWITFICKIYKSLFFIAQIGTKIKIQLIWDDRDDDQQLISIICFTGRVYS